MNTIETTVLFLRKGDEILLAMKKRGFGEGRYNSVGGKLEEGESAEVCVKRETLEEIDIRAISLVQMADLTFHEKYQGIPTIAHSSVYVCDEWEGEPIETEEMSPRWFNLSEIPYDNMWPDDIFWLPRVIDGEKVLGEFWFEDHNTVINHTVSNVESFDAT
ncbi:8-oxo-dGTP diphosphatase [Candidatus Saccharibacteria bacterium]|nr:8-oxo-dGTP diphosphatase [Candidatus Saccharibacteria bacterium]NCU40478.1 8-oxo-dGTP diphosphatase [Candidatus Saccharibacteria bacterium]